jgi:ubiquinone/menaquinone biosynthesis C-methylase UbiE
MRPNRPSWRMIQSLRLLRMGDNWFMIERVRDACRRVGLQPGDRVIDVGCGPLGALHVLDSIVGPSGTVVGLDSKAEALKVARGVIHRRRLDRVQLIQADINDVHPSALCPPGPFDVAYCRLFLVNQLEPAATLRHIASLVRPGGHIIAHEVLLDDPAYPVFDPPVPAFTRLLRLVYEATLQKGRRGDAARHLHDLACEAGLEDITQQAFFNATPSNAAEFLQSDGLGLLLGMEALALQTGLATPAEISDLAGELQDAALVEYRAFCSWVSMELIARVPRPP